MPSISMPPIMKQERYTFVHLATWLLHRTLKLRVGEGGQVEWGRQFSLTFVCEWSACRMYIEMPYKTKLTEWPGLGPFHSSHPVKQEHST